MSRKMPLVLITALFIGCATSESVVQKDAVAQVSEPSRTFSEAPLPIEMRLAPLITELPGKSAQASPKHIEKVPMKIKPSEEPSGPPVGKCLGRLIGATPDGWTREDSIPPPGAEVSVCQTRYGSPIAGKIYLIPENEELPTAKEMAQAFSEFLGQTKPTTKSSKVTSSGNDQAEFSFEDPNGGTPVKGRVAYRRLPGNGKAWARVFGYWLAENDKDHAQAFQKLVGSLAIEK